MKNDYCDIQHICNINIKLKICLSEIKDIIDFNSSNRLSGGTDIIIKQILQKIKEVLNEY